MYSHIEPCMDDWCSILQTYSVSASTQCHRCHHLHLRLHSGPKLQTRQQRRTYVQHRPVLSKAQIHTHTHIQICTYTHVHTCTQTQHTHHMHTNAHTHTHHVISHLFSINERTNGCTKVNECDPFAIAIYVYSRVRRSVV